MQTKNVELMERAADGFEATGSERVAGAVQQLRDAAKRAAEEKKAEEETKEDDDEEIDFDLPPRGEPGIRRRGQFSSFRDTCRAEPSWPRPDCPKDPRVAPTSGPCCAIGSSAWSRSWRASR